MNIYLSNVEYQEQLRALLELPGNGRTRAIERKLRITRTALREYIRIEAST